MADQLTALSELPKVALESYREEYKDLSENWRQLDTKAQGLGAIAGVFLAVVFSWAKDLSVDAGVVERITVGLVALLLIGAVIAAVLGLRLRSIATPPFGEKTAQMVSHFLQAGETEDMSGRVADLFNEQAEAWRNANATARGIYGNKAFWVAAGQILLLAAAVVVGFRTILLVLCSK